jgi:hypothetical protein
LAVWRARHRTVGIIIVAKVTPASLPMSSNCLKGEVALTDTHHPEFWAKAINLRSLILLGLTSCLGGCAAGQIIQNIPDAPLAGDLTEPNYRQIIAENLAIVFPNPVPLGMLEISGLRRIGSWGATGASRCDHGFLLRLWQLLGLASSDPLHALTLAAGWSLTSLMASP